MATSNPQCAECDPDAVKPCAVCPMDDEDAEEAQAEAKPAPLNHADPQTN